MRHAVGRVATEMGACPTCGELRLTGIPAGGTPATVTERVLMLCDLVRSGQLREGKLWDRYDKQERTLWSTLPGDYDVAGEVFAGGHFDSQLGVECVACRAQFVLSWVPDRGAVSWCMYEGQAANKLEFLQNG